MQCHRELIVTQNILETTCHCLLAMIVEFSNLMTKVFFKILKVFKKIHNELLITRLSRSTWVTNSTIEQ